MPLLVSTEQREKVFLCKIKAGRDKLHELRRRHAFGEVSMEVYQEFSTELTMQKDAILCEVEKRTKNLSNPNRKHSNLLHR